MAPRRTTARFLDQPNPLYDSNLLRVYESCAGVANGCRTGHTPREAPADKPSSAPVWNLPMSESVVREDATHA